MDQKKTGKFIQRLRKEKNLTQKELAEKLHVSDKTISKWETGNGMPDMSSLVVLGETLEVSINELLSGEKLSQSDYSQKAEDNMVELLKENEENRVGNGVQTVFGCILAVLAVGFAVLNPSANRISWYLDLPTFIEIAVICGAIILLCGKGKLSDIPRILQKAVIPAGILTACSNAIGLFENMNNHEQIGHNISVVLLSIVYSVLVYLILIPINIRIKKKKAIW